MSRVVALVDASTFETDWIGGAVGRARGAEEVETRDVHSEVSQYGERCGRSACSAIALTLACNFFQANDDDDEPGNAIGPAFLGDGVVQGIELYGALRGKGDGGPEHSSVEELLEACSRGTDPRSRNVASALEPLDASPRQGILSDSTDHPMGLEAMLSQCQADGAVCGGGYVAVVLTKPPETVLVLLPPLGGQGPPSSMRYVLLDSHPRPRQLAPHFPAGSNALFHPSLASLVDSVRQIFPPTDLGGACRK